MRADTETSIALTASNISKHYGKNQVLDDVSVEIERGTIHALVGGNGCGKSTFIKILAGAVPGDPGGTVTVRGEEITTADLTPHGARERGLRFVHQDLGLFNSMTVAENLALGREYPRNRFHGVDWKEVRRRAVSVLDRFEITVSPDHRVADLRPADRTMVAIARALQDQSDVDDAILILDEPTASLAIAEVQTLLAALKRYAQRGQTIVIVSHRLSEIVEIADTITVLRDGRLVTTTPNVGIDTERLAELIVGRATAAQSVDEYVPGEPVLSVRGLSGGPVHDVDLTLHAGEVVGVAGLVGSGRTTLLRLLAGAVKSSGGTVALRDRQVDLRSPAAVINQGLVYLPEDRAGDAAFPDLSIRENLSAIDVGKYWNRFRVAPRPEHDDADIAIADFGIVCHSQDQPISTLSGGNQQKVIVARVMRTRPDVLLLDEPSQGVDVGARADIHGHIRRYVEGGAAALIVSSDLEELAAWCDRVVVLRGGELCDERRAPELDPVELAALTEVG